MFDFFNMSDNYEQRKVDNYKDGELVIDTCSVNDSDEPFETGICHPKYNDGKWVIVEMYSNKKEAKLGHKRWIKTMTNSLPKELKDVSTSEIKKLLDYIS